MAMALLMGLGGLITLLVMLMGFILYEYMRLRGKSRSVRWNMEKQGIRGPSPSSVWLGNLPEINKIKSNIQSQNQNPSKPIKDNNDPCIVNLSHDWPSHLFPYLKLWKLHYGPVFIYSTGGIHILCVMDPHIVKEISLCTSIDLGKPSYLSKHRGPLLGQGIVSSSGSIWSPQRKIIAPEFYPDKVKGMMGMIAEATASMLGSWEEKIDNSGGVAEITIDEDLRKLSADIISKAAFGSSYSQGKEIFSKIRALQNLMSKTPLVGIPGSRFVLTKTNRQIRRLEKDINSMILRVVKERQMGAKHENDFLKKILESAKMCDSNQENGTLKMDHDKFIVDNCKTIYFAGHETTAVTATWGLMLLAANPEWQARARAEVHEVCRDGIPAADDLRNMKVLTMIIQETLRLYPPATFLVRAALEDAKLNNIQVPKDIDIQVPTPLLHHDQDLWGSDAHMFNPERFANGLAAACKVPHAYVPFGFGARICLGQHMAVVELKMVLSLILSKYSFSLSPAYRHSPAFRLVIEPEHGVILHIKRA